MKIPPEFPGSSNILNWILEMATLKQTLGTIGFNRPNYKSYGIPQLISDRAFGGGQTSSPSYSSPLFDAQATPIPMPSSEYVASFDYDPAMQSISALGNMSAEQAQNEGTNLQRQLFIDAGAPDIAAEYGADPNTIEAARQNPFSSLAKLRKDYAKRGSDLTENLNMSNLFYSSERAKKLKEQEEGRSEGESRFIAGLRKMVGAAAKSVLDAQEKERIANPPTQLATALSGTTAGAVADAAIPTAAAPAASFPDTPTPPLPTWSGQTALPTWSGQTQLPTWNAPTQALPTFDPSHTTLPPFDPTKTMLPKKQPSGYRNLFTDLL